jgi:RNA polymerase sigma-70 factor (ECF subfamily)
MSSAVKDFTDVSDEILIAQIAVGDESAFNELVGRHMKMLYAATYRMNFDTETAEDVLQEAFIRVWQKAHTWRKDGGAAVSTWLYRITYNICIDLKRKKTPIPVEELQEAESEAPIQDELISQSQVSAIVEEAMAAIPDSQRQALVLCHYQGFSNAEAAEIMGKSVKSIESLLVRARKALREILEGKKDMLDIG